MALAMVLLFSIDLPLILHLVLSKLCHEYIMKSIFVTFPGRRSRCGRTCRKVWFLIRLPRNLPSTPKRMRGLFDDFMHQGESNQLGLSERLTPQLLQFLRRGYTWKPYFGWVLCFLCKYLVYISSNQESLCSSHISMFWVVLEIFWWFLVIFAEK